MSTLIIHIPSQLYYCPKSVLRRHGSFYRKSDSKTVLRWRCLHCRKTISQATDTPCLNHLEYLQRFENRNISYLQFDEMETHEHTQDHLDLYVDFDNRVLIR